MRLLILASIKISRLFVTTLKVSLFLLPFVLFSCTCKKEEKKLTSAFYTPIPGYDLANPAMIQLTTNLEEISGITYYPTDSSIFAIDDEEGVLYKIYIRNKVRVRPWKFAGDGDYEDIVLHDSTFYALRSDGNVKIFNFLSRDSINLQESSVPIGGSNNFETLYYDPHFKKIITICKDCQTDGRKATSAFALDPGTHTFSDTPVFTIKADDIGEEIGIDKLKFRPSAAAVHPITNDVYIISSENKILVITNHSGKIKDVYDLDPRLFKQPEGITFTPAGDLLVSNEAADLSAPNILIFKYKPTSNEKD